jgi:hypothetical protein
MRLLYVTGWTSARLPCYPAASHGKVSPDAVVRGFRDRTADAADVSPRWEPAMTPADRLEPLGEATTCPVLHRSHASPKTVRAHGMENH